MFFQGSNRVAMKEKGVNLMLANPLFLFGADEQDRTADLLITNQLLYRLSYIGFVLRGWSNFSEELCIYRKKYPLSSFSCTFFTQKIISSAGFARV